MPRLITTEATDRAVRATSVARSVWARTADKAGTRCRRCTTENARESAAPSERRQAGLPRCRQLCVVAALFDQFVVTAELGQLTADDDADAIGPLHRR